MKQERNTYREEGARHRVPEVALRREGVRPQDRLFFFLYSRLVKLKLTGRRGSAIGRVARGRATRVGSRRGSAVRWGCSIRGMGGATYMKRFNGSRGHYHIV